MKNPISVIKKYFSLKGSKRSVHWRSVRNDHLKIEGWCRGCGSIKDLEVHHIHPFHLDPSRELDPKNLITLCESFGKECHLKMGHLGNWKKFNPDIKKQATIPKPNL